MIIFFDQNISFRVSRKSLSQFYNCIHISECGLLNSTDFTIWDYCKKNNYCILTFDHDFIDLSLLKGAPPKVILIKKGNIKTNELIALLQKHENEIGLFLSSSDEETIMEIF